MRDSELIRRLEALREQSYPLTVTEDDATAIYLSIRRVMSAVAEDDQVFVRGDYNLVTSAICHPSPISND